MSIDTVTRSGKNVFVPGTREWMDVVLEIGVGFVVRPDGILHVPFADEAHARMAVDMLRERYPGGVRSE